MKRRHRKTNWERFVDYMYETFENKICAIVMIVVGAFTAMLSNDSGALVVLSLFAVPLFFARKQWIF